jgi:hypothetical protein
MKLVIYNLIVEVMSAILSAVAIGGLVYIIIV